MTVTKRAKPEASPYWQELIDEYSRQYEAMNSVPCPWGNKRAFALLRQLLAGNPRWTREIWLACVRHMFMSEDLNLAAPPELNIPKLPCYVRGPLNKFHELKPVAPEWAQRPLPAAVKAIDPAAAPVRRGVWRVHHTGESAGYLVSDDGRYAGQE